MVMRFCRWCWLLLLLLTSCTSLHQQNAASFSRDMLCHWEFYVNSPEERSGQSAVLRLFVDGTLQAERELVLSEQGVDQVVHATKRVSTITAQVVGRGSTSFVVEADKREKIALFLYKER